MPLVKLLGPYATIDDHTAAARFVADFVEKYPHVQAAHARDAFLSGYRTGRASRATPTAKTKTLRALVDAAGGFVPFEAAVYMVLRGQRYALIDAALVTRRRRSARAGEARDRVVLLLSGGKPVGKRKRSRVKSRT